MPFDYNTCVRPVVSTVGGVLSSALVARAGYDMLEKGPNPVNVLTTTVGYQGLKLFIRDRTLCESCTAYDIGVLGAATAGLIGIRVYRSCSA